MLLYNLQSYLPDEEEVFGGKSLAGSGCVLLERDIQHPVEVVLDSPVSSCQHVVVCSLGIVLVTYVIPFSDGRPVTIVHCRCYLDNGLQSVPS